MKIGFKTALHGNADVGDLLVPREFFESKTLWGTGDNGRGSLGINNTSNKSSPVQTVVSGTNWKLINAGSYFSGAIKTNGTLWMFGDNEYGQLGTNDINHRSSPTQITPSGWKTISCGADYSSATKIDGTLWLWGRNLNGQLGTNDTTNRSTPVQTAAGGTDWKLSVSGSTHTGAIKTDGTLWMWGYNFYGQLGNDTNTDISSPAQTNSDTNWKTVSCGDNFTVAIKTDGTLWAWGKNAEGQLGTNNRTIKSSPVQTVFGGTNWSTVSCGFNHTAAIKTDGTLWVWGQNNWAALGTNDLLHRSTPVQTAAGGTNWKSVSSGGNNSGAIKTDGTLWLWGYNASGQLGTNDLLHRSSPVQTVFGGTNWRLVSAGKFHSLMINNND